MASSRRSTEVFERVDSAIDAQWKHHCYTWHSRAKGPPKHEKKEGITKGILFMIHVLNYNVFIDEERILEAS